MPAVAAIHNAAWQVEHKNFADKDLLKKLNRIFTSEYLQDKRQAIARARNFPEHSFFNVALEYRELVGFIQAERKNDLRGQSIIAVERLYVLPAKKRIGIGRSLVNDLLEWSKDGEQLAIIVAAYNDENINLYRSYGFVENIDYCHDHRHLSAVQMTITVGAELRERIKR